jgi:anti-sigma factor RsiW
VNCDVALERMLEADPDELAGRGDSELALHVAGCARCGAVAAELLAGQETLAAGLRSLEGGRDVEVVLDGVRRAAARRRRRRRLLSRVAAPLAAAAALALLVVGDRGSQVRPQASLPPRAAVSRPEQTVRLAPNTNAVVFETDNPKITVVWFY